MKYDITILTDARWLEVDHDDWYSVQLCREDALLFDALAARGLAVARRAWDDPDFDWASTRSAVFRTTWDYFDRFPEFAPWLARVQHQTRLFNDAPLIHWNVDKHYLAELVRAGVNTVPTAYMERGDTRTLEQALADTGWHDAILKPAVSGSARHTYRVAPGQCGPLECTYAKLIQAEAMMLQPFQRQVLEHGEVSLMVVDGRVTHAIRKTPGPGDFRVQDDHGGRVHPHSASAEEAAFAEAAVAAVPHDVVYARVDVVRDNDGRLAIMELEMIEPELFFRFHPEAAERLATALAQRLVA